MTPAIELRDVTKVYRRYGGHRFSTLKSALLQRSTGAGGSSSHLERVSGA